MQLGAISALAAPSIESVKLTPQPLSYTNNFRVKVKAAEATQGTVTVDLRPTVAKMIRLSLSFEGDTATATGALPADFKPCKDVTLNVSTLLFNASGQRALKTSTVPYTTNCTPKAVIGRLTKKLAGETVTLDGTGCSDPEGSTLTYEWRLVPPTGSIATLKDGSTPRPMFLCDVAGIYKVKLSVSDGQLSAEAETEVEATEPIRAMLSGGDFESGNLNSWIAQGEAGVITNLGTVNAYQGFGMGYLSTGGKAYFGRSSCLAQKFTVPQGAQRLRIAYNVVSEEFPVGSAANNDVFAATLSSATGSNQVTFETINSAFWKGYAERVPLRYSSGGTNWVETGWSVASADVSQLGGQEMTLTLSVCDAGDSLFSTMVLLDTIGFDAAARPGVSANMPNLRGKHLAEAQQILANSRLHCKVEMVKLWKPWHGIDTAFEQNAAPGEVLPENSTITLYSVQPVEIPDLIGLTEGEVFNKLGGNIWWPWTVQYVAASGTQTVERVISQSPTAGSQGLRQSGIRVTVPIDGVKVPDLLGLQQPEAEATLTNLNLHPSFSTVPAPEGYALGQVCGQEPKPGEVLRKDASVEVNLSGPAGVEIPLLLGLTKEAATQVLTNLGLGVHFLTAATPAGFADGTAVAQQPGPREQARPRASVFVWVATAAGIEVPEVLGLTETQAKAALKAVGLTNVSSEPKLTPIGETDGTVFWQWPVGGMVVPEQSGVTIHVGVPGIEVPSTLGLTREQAERVLAEAGLQSSVTAVVTPEGVPDGTVLDQSPKPSTRTLPRAWVQLTVAAGKGVTVPKVVGKSLADGTAAMETANLPYSLSYVLTPPGSTPGSIVGQSPAGESVVLSGTTVHLQVAIGTLVPDVIALSEAAATNIIAASNLLASVSYAYAPEGVAAGTVFKQSPAPNSAAYEGSWVYLTVAISQLVTVPDFTGMLVEDAEASLNHLGLSWSTTPVPTPPGSKDGIVVEQSVGAGQQVQRGTWILLGIGSGPGITIPDLMRLTEAEAKQRVTAAGISNYWGQLVVTPPGAVDGTVVFQSPTPGKIVFANEAFVQVQIAAGAGVTVPSLIGVPEPEAAQMLMNLGLSNYVKRVITPAGALDGTVVAQWPDAGERVLTNTLVELLVAAGKGVAVPELLGRTEWEATNILTAAHFSYTVQHVFTPNGGTNGTVLYQWPPANELVLPDASVYLQIANGAATTVPDVLGMSEAVAIHMLTNAHLQASVSYAYAPEGVPVGTVFSQWPTANSQVYEESWVYLTVAISQTVTVPDLSGMLATDAEASLNGLGLSWSTTPVATPPGGKDGTVVQQSVSAGQQVQRGTWILLSIGSGPGITIPDLIGLPEGEAKQRVAAAGISNYWRQLVVTPAGAVDGTVVSQSPQPGGLILPEQAYVNVQIAAGPGVTVPATIGLRESEALLMIGSLGLSNNVNRVITPDGAVDGTVLSQWPNAGERVLTNSVVLLTVAAGKGVSVPELLGRFEVEATNALAAANLSYYVQYVFTPSGGTNGTVLYQWPAANELVVPQSTVYLQIAGGAATTVPDLIGLSEFNARFALSNAQLSVVVSYYFAPDDSYVGRVFSQSPAAYNQVYVGSLVNLTVGTSRDILLPDLSGMRQEDAGLTLTNLGLYCSVVSVATPPGYTNGTVVQQSPSSGARLVPPAWVSIYVGREPGITIPDVLGLSEVEAKERLKAAGVTNYSTWAVVTPPGSVDGTVLTQWPAPNTAVLPEQAYVSLQIAGGPGIVVPALIGMAEEDALHLLAELQLSNYVQRVVTPEGAVDGTVLQHWPAAGERVATNTLVYLNVAGGRTTVPNVLGNFLGAAIDVITSTNLNYSLQYTLTPPGATNNTVLSQWPNGNEVAIPNSTVYLQIAADQLVTVPNLLGLTELQANNVLTNVNLGAIPKYVWAQPGQTNGTVISQSPMGGNQWCPGGLIEVMIASTGVTVPDLTGLAAQDAEELLRQSGLSYSLTYTPTPDWATNGTVLAQEPAPGSLVLPLGGITLNLANFEGVRMPNLLGLGLDAALNRLQELGLKANVNYAPPPEAMPEGIVFEQQYAPDTILERGSNVGLVITSKSGAP